MEKTLTERMGDVIEKLREAADELESIFGTGAGPTKRNGSSRRSRAGNATRTQKGYSEATRKKLAAAAKRRWATAKKAGKKTL